MTLKELLVSATLIGSTMPNVAYPQTTPVLEEISPDIINIDGSNIDNVLDAQYAVIMYTVEGCEPCETVYDILKNVARKTYDQNITPANIVFGIVDLTTDFDYWEHFTNSPVNSFPTVSFLDHGRELPDTRISGLSDRSGYTERRIANTVTELVAQLD